MQFGVEAHQRLLHGLILGLITVTHYTQSQMTLILHGYVIQMTELICFALMNQMIPQCLKLYRR